MSREVRRVPVDFDWSLNKVWKGYLMPAQFEADNCTACSYERSYGESRGTGYTPEAWAIATTFYVHQIGGDRERAEKLAWHDKIGQAEVDNLLEQGRLRTCVKREPTEDNPRGWKWVALPRTAAEVNATQTSMLEGHDSINRMILIEFRCKMLGIPLSCTACDGKGSVDTYEGQTVDREAWEWVEPPTGEGWQLWETVSEGSPISPVFANRDGLIRWLSTEYRTVGDQCMTVPQAEAFVDAGSSIGSFVMAGGKIIPGDIAVSEVTP